MEIEAHLALVFPVFNALATIPGATAGQFDEHDHLVAFPVEHGRLRVELVVELCGQWAVLRGTPVGEDGWSRGGGIGDCQLTSRVW